MSRTVGLTAKERAFCEAYVNDGFSILKAYNTAYPGQCSHNCRSVAYRMFHKEDIQAYIKELRERYFMEHAIDGKRIVGELSKIAFEDPNASNKDKIQALSLLTKCFGLETTTQKVEVSGSADINITITGDNTNGDQS